jgi:hypothetical protein
MSDYDQELIPVLLLLAVGCHKADESALAPAASSSVVAAHASASAAPVAAIEKDAELEAPAEVAWSDGGTWISSDIYDFKLESAKYCSKPASKADTADAKADSVWLGVRSQVLAKTDEVFVDRRHATLRDKGIYFQASLDPEPLGGCTPAFKPAHLKKGQTTAGYIVFELPKAWPNLVLEFQPTRWGGAGKVRAKVPDPGKAP